MHYFYFVAYNLAPKNKMIRGTWGYGNTELELKRPITSMDDINEVAKHLESTDPDYQYMINNFILLRTEEDTK